MPSAHGESHRTINRIAATLQHVEEGSDLRVVNHGFLERFFASNGAASLCAIAKLRNSASNQVSSERRSSSEGAQKAKPVFYAVRKRSFCPQKDIIFRVQIWLASISVQISSEKTNQKNIPP